jgi:hypothetical protein
MAIDLAIDEEFNFQSKEKQVKQKDQVQSKIKLKLY